MLQVITRNRNARNYGLGTRDMSKAATFAMREGGGSFSTVATQTERFKPFCEFMRERYNIKDLRFIREPHLIEYADHVNGLTEREEKPIAIKTAHNRLSAVNRVLEQARGDKDLWISPSKYLPPKSGIATHSRAPSTRLIDEANRIFTDARFGDRFVAMGQVCVQFGLRFKESVLLNGAKALREALETGAVTISRGAKGGKSRTVPITSQAQIRALSQVAHAQGQARCLIPNGMSYKEFRAVAYRVNAKTNLNGWHGLRHRYAQQRYLRLMGVPCPVNTGIRHGVMHHRYIADQLGCSLAEAKSRDKEVRERIAEELGHGRAEITNSYLG